MSMTNYQPRCEYSHSIWAWNSNSTKIKDSLFNGIGDKTVEVIDDVIDDVEFDESYYYSLSTMGS